jgi:thioredoxin reductase (NADPH)
VTCDGPFYKGEEMLVVGGGNSGFEEGLFLTKFETKVTILEVGDTPRASRVLQEQVENGSSHKHHRSGVQRQREDERCRRQESQN